MDFVVIDMDEGRNEKDVKLLLGLSVMVTAQIVIDMHEGKLTMKVLDETVKFNIFDCMTYPDDKCHKVDMLEYDLDEVVEERFGRTTSYEDIGLGSEDEGP
ncbi:hypothetical protein Dsin_017370 [Dipteronia sinensis]|uniref:Uncharacterized protein n=1 Tax=Dipteronia sinensis TaxID=43782 RepID=A0AAE0AEX2_9ROSI|nr:hypothetical protein Dsin_017370 [Dipteronia sinensis]